MLSLTATFSRILFWGRGVGVLLRPCSDETRYADQAALKFRELPVCPQGVGIEGTPPHSALGCHLLDLQKLISIFIRMVLQSTSMTKATKLDPDSVTATNNHISEVLRGPLRGLGKCRGLAPSLTA